MAKILMFTEHKYEEKGCLAPWCIWQLDLSSVYFQIFISY